MRALADNDATGALWFVECTDFIGKKPGGIDDAARIDEMYSGD